MKLQTPFHRAVVSMIFALLLVQPALGSFRPGFSNDADSWRATDIAVVAVTDTDGVFVVLETWKGNLPPGEQIRIPELAPPTGAQPLSRYRPPDLNSSGGLTIRQQLPGQPAGSQLVVYLIKPPDSAAAVRWLPADPMSSMEASAVWIESDRLFWFSQENNPGPSILRPRGSLAETDLKNHAQEVARLQQRFQQVVSIQNGAHRAQSLKQFVHSDNRWARHDALAELGKSGVAAAPVIEAMLDDSAYAPEAGDLVKALHKAGGEAVSASLVTRFQREVAFWESRGPSLAPGWWNIDVSPDAPLQLRYSVTIELIRALTESPNDNALLPAERLHDLWVSSPALDDASGLNQMADECQHLIDLLQSKSGLPSADHR